MRSNANQFILLGDTTPIHNTSALLMIWGKEVINFGNKCKNIDKYTRCRNLNSIYFFASSQAQTLEEKGEKQNK